MNGRVFVFLIMLLLIVPLPQVDAKTYKWRDENGKPHFTDDPTKVPKKKPAPPPEKANDLQSGLEDAIFLECKTKRHQFFDTTLWRFNPTIPELIWVKDTDGLEINFSMTIEGYADGLIKSSFTAEQMLLALLALKDLDPEQKAELGLMKVMYNSFIALSKKFIREGVPPEESKIKAQERMGINLISKQYVELDLSSGEILWIETGLTPPTSKEKEIKKKVWKGKCTKLERN